MAVDPKQMTAQAGALTGASRLEEAVALYRQTIALTPNSVSAEHNLAAALGDAGRWREAETHLRSAFTKGGDAPETWLVTARCQQALGRLDASETAFRNALRRRPAYYDAHRELAQLRWMRTGDLAAALEELERAINSAPADAHLMVLKAQAHEHAGDLSGAWDLLEPLAANHPNSVMIANYAAQVATEIGADKAAVALAERAVANAPDQTATRITLLTAYLAIGEIARASALAAEVRLLAPDNQHAIALQAVAWRLLGDPRYRALYDYEAFISTTWIDTPTGWLSREAYLSDLSAALHREHRFLTHPFDQSVRHGAQAPDILQLDHPATRALPEALDRPIRRHIQALGWGADALRSRNAGSYAFQGMWSIRLGAGGFHIDHVHPNGWLSSACYVDVPSNTEGKEGWIRFGKPGVRTTPALEAEHFIEPAPGKLVLFPSYMWHGTIPFCKQSTRMSVAFDLTPASQIAVAAG